MGLISRVSSRTYRSGSYRHETNMADAVEPQARPISKKHLFVRDGLFKSEADEFFKRELAEDGYSGIVVRKSKTCEIIIIAAYGVVRFVMESGAKGCEVIVSGKIRGQRA